MPSKQSYTDFSYLQQFTKGDTGRIAKYLEMYLSSAPAVIDELASELDLGNYENLRLKAHSIKPQVQYLGIVSLKEVLMEIEHIIRQEADRSKLGELVRQAQEISEGAKAEINAYLGRQQF